MPKLILEFDTNEEQEEYETALNGQKYKNILNDFNQHLKSIVKYASADGKEYTEKEQELVLDLSNKLWDLISDECVEI